MQAGSGYLAGKQAEKVRADLVSERSKLHQVLPDFPPQRMAAQTECGSWIGKYRRRLKLPDGTNLAQGKREKDVGSSPGHKKREGCKTGKGPGSNEKESHDKGRNDVILKIEEKEEKKKKNLAESALTFRRCCCVHTCRKTRSETTDGVRT